MSDEPWATPGFEEPQTPFKGPTQRAKFWSEDWVARSLFCPNCGERRLSQFPANREVADFECRACSEEYELKAKSGRFGPRVLDGAYAAMLRRLEASNNPNLLLMNYDPVRRGVTNLFVLPKQFFRPEMIEPKKPTQPRGRAQPWIGCHIRIDTVPPEGRINLVREGVFIPKDAIRAAWEHSRFLRERRPEARGWLLAVWDCVRAIDRSEFTLDEVYAFEQELSLHYPGNNNVRAKIRQQLQVLRDHGWLRFDARGRYSRVRGPG